jgi:hypothetical protein
MLEKDFIVEKCQTDEEIKSVKVQPQLLILHLGSAACYNQFPNQAILSQVDCPIAIFLSFDSHFHSHGYIINYLDTIEFDAIFANDFYWYVYPERYKDKLFVIPNSYNDLVFKSSSIGTDITCGFFGAGFFHGKLYPWRKAMASRVLPEFPSLALPRPSGLRSHSFVGEEFANVMAKTQFIFACTSAKDIPVKKLFEIPAVGRMLICNKSDVLESFGFESGVNCAVVDESNVLQTIRYYLDNPEEYRRVVNAGKKLVEEHHKPECRDHVFKWLTSFTNCDSTQKVIQVDLLGEFKSVDKSISSPLMHQFLPVGINNRFNQIGSIVTVSNIAEIFPASQAILDVAPIHQGAVKVHLAYFLLNTCYQEAITLAENFCRVALVKSTMRCEPQLFDLLIQISRLTSIADTTHLNQFLESHGGNVQAKSPVGLYENTTIDEELLGMINSTSTN